MNNRKLYCILSVLIFVLTGPLSGCVLKLISMGSTGPPPKFTSPYGAYFIKSGMTREERLKDISVCGSNNGLRVDFTKEKVEEANKTPIQVLDGSRRYINDGFFVLLRRFDACMKSKGYIQIPVGMCDGDQEYQPLCMYP